MRQRVRLGRCLLLLIGVAAWWLLAGARGAFAQESKPRTDPSAAEKPAEVPMAEQPLPFEVMPPVYMLKDKDGKLQPVPGFKFEQFMELYKFKNQLDQQNQPPTFTIESVAISGASKGQRAELTATFAVLVHAAGWIRVPLRLGGSILREQATFEGEGEHFLHPDAEGDGFIGWIRSVPGKTHRIKLTLAAPLAALGPETHLRLSTPRAAVSNLELQVPMDRAVVTLSEGSTLESTSPSGGGTNIKVRGLGSDLDIGWHAAESQVASLPTLFEANCAQLVRIDGRNINTEARLSVRSSGGEFDRFQVRLPPGADYVETSQAGASLAAVDGSNSKGKLYEVRLGKKTTGPIEVRLVTQRGYDPGQAGEPLELAGFEVVGAVRQWGTIGAQVEPNWQVQWGKDERVRSELANLPGRESLSAAFEYTAQPYSLTARIAPQKTRVRVEGEYVLLVDGEEARLRGRLKYVIRGSKIRVLEVEMPGWDVDVVGPVGVVSVDEIDTNQAEPLAIPLLQPVSGELEVTVEARQRIPGGATRVELEIPRPRGEIIAPANVAVVPADDVELTVRHDETVGLAVQSVRPQLKQLPERQQDPLFFRTTDGGGKFVASLKAYEQSISVTASAHLDVDERETHVEQRIVFQIAYHPTDHLTFDVPRGIRPDKVTFAVDGQKLSPTTVRERPEGITSVRVPLPAPRIGRCEVAINYTSRHERPSTAAYAMVKVPLVVPADGQLTSNELTAIPKPGLSLKYPKGFSTGPWIEDPRSSHQGGPGSLHLTARRGVGDVTLSLNFRERRMENAFAIEQAWIQTRLTDVERQDRAVYRFATSEPRLRLALPNGAQVASAEVILDGRRVRPDADANREQNELVIPISGASRGEHVLDLRYHFPDRASQGELVLESPRFAPEGWVRQLYWQLIVPNGEHVVFSPPGMSREFRWTWTDFFWRRQAPLEERELEDWIGAGSSAENDRLSGETAEQFAARQQARYSTTNRYLYSSVGTPEALRVYSLHRAPLVLAASLPLLACGLLLIYFPVIRHPATLLALAVVLVVAALIDPDAALLFAQASSLGLVLAVAAALLARVSVGPVPVTIPMHGSSKALERQAIDVYARSSGSGSQPSTTTNPLVPSAPEGSP
jgi:hypothetical protein